MVDWLLKETNDEYHGTKGNLSSHRLAAFRHCPLMYWKEREGLIPDKDSAAFVVGRAAHTFILEGEDALDEQYAVGGPVNPKTGKTFDVTSKTYLEWAGDQGKPAISDEVLALIELQAAAVRQHPVAAEILAADDGVAEGVLRLPYHGHWCQGRFDWYSPTWGLADLKTTENLDWFVHDARKWGYLYQLAFYHALLITKLTERVGIATAFANIPVRLIAVEKNEPFRCGVWRVPERLLDEARRENEADMTRLAKCEADDVWPTNYEAERELDNL